MSFQIQFRNSQTSFHPAERLQKDDWIDTSFSQFPSAIGHLRFHGPSNGRYESKHPVCDEHGTTVGFLLNGQNTLGYTFASVYAGNSFWIAHQGFFATMNGGGSSISLVEATGKYLFSNRGIKFTAVKSFGFGGHWVDTIRAFKLLDRGHYLLYLSEHGFCLFDVHQREIVSKAEFSNFLCERSSFALSPKVKLLAIAGSARSNQDPLDGEYRYTNFIKIYNLETGLSVGEQPLPGDRKAWWTVDFSADGRQLQIGSTESTHVFELTTS